MTGRPSRTGRRLVFLFVDKRELNAYRQSKYTKPYFFVDDQLAKLKSHGLEIEDYETAKSVLRKSGYFRFSGYAYWFKEDGEFRSGTTFAQVADLYRFDESVRKKFMEGLELIEVWLRTQLSSRLGYYHPFAHRIPLYLRKNVSIWSASPHSIKQSAHIAWIADFSREEQRSQGDFVEHFRKKYGPHLPVWAATEVMTLGTLRRLFDLIHEEDSALIAARAGITHRDGKGDHGTFSSWLNHFRYLRNVCAHYGRVWNKTFDITPAAPQKHIEELSDFKSLAHKPYKTIAAMRYMFARIYPGSSWSSEMRELREEFSRRSSVPLAAMGFPEGWNEKGMWDVKYQPDLEACSTIDSVNQIECIPRSKLLGTIFPDRNEQEKKDLLRYLTKKKGLFAHEIGGTKYYPTFQFTADLSDIDVNVGDVNEILIDKLAVRDHVAQLVQEWWVNGELGPGVRLSPMKMVKQSPNRVLEAAQEFIPRSDS